MFLWACVSETTVFCGVLTLKGLPKAVCDTAQKFAAHRIKKKQTLVSPEVHLKQLLDSSHHLGNSSGTLEETFKNKA